MLVSNFRYRLVIFLNNFNSAIYSRFVVAYSLQDVDAAQERFVAIRRTRFRSDGN